MKATILAIFLLFAVVFGQEFGKKAFERPLNSVGFHQETFPMLTAENATVEPAQIDMKKPPVEEAAIAQVMNMSAFRVLHGSPDAPAVDVYVDGELAIRDLMFMNSTSFIPIPEGMHDIMVTLADMPKRVVYRNSIMIAGGMLYTVAAYDRLADIKFLVWAFPFPAAPEEGFSWLEIIHADLDLRNTTVTIRFTRSGGKMLGGKGGFFDVEGIRFAEPLTFINSLRQIPAGTWDIEVINSETGAVVRRLPAIDVRSDDFYSIALF